MVTGKTIGGTQLASAELLLPADIDPARGSASNQYFAAVAATRDLADRLQYTMADLGYRFPKYPLPPDETEAAIWNNKFFVWLNEFSVAPTQ